MDDKILIFSKNDIDKAIDKIWGREAIKNSDFPTPVNDPKVFLWGGLPCAGKSSSMKKVSKMYLGNNSFVDSYFNGHGGGDNNAGVAMAQRFVSNTLREASNGLTNGTKAGYSAITKANSANSSKSLGSKAFGAMKTMGGMVVGATFGATVGGIKGAVGANSYNNGYGSGSFSATALNGATKADQKGIDSISELSGKATESITGNNPLSSKDRNGFDTSLINDDSSSMSGEIKPS